MALSDDYRINLGEWGWCPLQIALSQNMANPNALPTAAVAEEVVKRLTTSEKQIPQFVENVVSSKHRMERMEGFGVRGRN